jgi:hypothetical protein
VPANGPASTAVKWNCKNQNVGLDLMQVRKLRQEMEKVRLLLELIRKRERMKKEMMRIHEMSLRLKLEPFTIFLHRTLDQLQAADTAGIFARPVSEQEAPDYLSIIEYPMDFATMRSKIDSLVYKSYMEFVADFWLIVNNCQTYNADGSMYYKLAAKLGERGKVILDAACLADKENVYNCMTGLHNSDCGEDSLLQCIVRPCVKKYQTTRRRSNCADDTDGPPELSRCPTPVFDSECTFSTSFSASEPSYVSAFMIVDPPALTSSQPSANDCKNMSVVESETTFKETPNYILHI